MRKHYLVLDLTTGRYLNNPYWELSFGPVDNAYQFDWSDPNTDFQHLWASFVEREVLDKFDGRILTIVEVYVPQ